jgi:hypothetical protein
MCARAQEAPKRQVCVLLSAVHFPSNLVYGTAPEDQRPPRPTTGGARRITKEERERQEREAEREAAGK